MAQSQNVASTEECRERCIGPAFGAVLLAGGGELGPEIYQRFVEMAGGPDARIVIIPTAKRDRDFPPGWTGTLPFFDAGARTVYVLHTRDPGQADREEFVVPLREATGVWVEGGRPWRLVDAYAHTRVVDEIQLLLARGGVVGGTSAGASILASFLVRGDPAGNEVLVSQKYHTGFGLLQGIVVDQHVVARGRQQDLLEVLSHHPELLGIGIDEGSAIVIRGDRAEVVGRSAVGFYDPGEPTRLFTWLQPGESFDLEQRTRMEPATRQH